VRDLKELTQKIVRGGWAKVGVVSGHSLRG